MAVADRHKKENFEIKYHNLFGRGQVTKKATVRKLEFDLLNEVGASFNATEIVFSVNRPGKTEIVEVDGIKLCIDTDITTTDDNERSIMIRATVKSRQIRNIVVVLNAALQDGVERQILPCTEHHQLLGVSEKPQTTKKIAIMESITQALMFMIGFCSLTVKIRLYRLPLELLTVNDGDHLPSSIENSTIEAEDDGSLSLPESRGSTSIEEDDEVVFVVEETPISLRRSMLSRCSKFLTAYSQSAMAESHDSVFPIQDCSFSEFSELLSISEGERDIDEDNLDSMLELADRFIMPQASLPKSILAKCELYLAAACGYGAAELLYLADRYRLHMLALFVINLLHTEDDLISLMEFEGFELMSESMKAVIWKRFHNLTE